MDELFTFLDSTYQIYFPSPYRAKRDVRKISFVSMKMDIAQDFKMQHFTKNPHFEIDYKVKGKLVSIYFYFGELRSTEYFIFPYKNANYILRERVTNNSYDSPTQYKYWYCEIRADELKIVYSLCSNLARKKARSE